MNRKRKVSPVLVSLSENITEVPKCTIIDSPNFVLGRSTEVNLQVQFSTVSKNHCRFVYDENTDTWSIISNTDRKIVVDERNLEKHGSAILECGNKIKIAPFTLKFRCSSECNCRNDLKRVKLETKSNVDIENVIIIDDDDDDDVIGSHQLPDSSSDDIYLNPTPSCSGVSLPTPKANSPLSIEQFQNELEKYFEYYPACPFKEELNGKFEYVKKIDKFNLTSALYFSDPSENYSLNSSINNMASFFEEECSKISCGRTLCKSEENPLHKVVLNLDSLLMEKTKHAMGFLQKFLHPPPRQSTENSSSWSKIGEKESLQVQFDKLKEEMKKIKKENEELKNKEEDRRNKDALEQKIEMLEQQIAELTFENANLLKDICSTADEIAVLKDPIPALPPVVGPGTSKPPASVPLTSNLYSMPFEVLKFLLKASKETTEDGIVLRRSLLDHGVFEMILGCLAIFSHHPNLSNSSKNEYIMNCLKIVRNSCTVGSFSTTPPVTTKKNPKAPKAPWSDIYYENWGDMSGSKRALMAKRWKEIEEENITVLLLVLASYINTDPLLHGKFDIIQIGELNYDEKPSLPQNFVKLVEDSCLLPVLSSHLTNDSVLDMGRHIPLYRAIMVLLRVLAFNTMTVKFFLPPDCQASTSASNKVISLVEPLVKIKKLVDTYSSTLRKTKSAAYLFTEQEGEDINSLIADIQATYMIVDMNSQGFISKTITMVPQNSASETAEERYRNVMEKLKFDSYDMIVENPDGGGYLFHVSHHFEDQIRSDGERAYPAKMKRLAQEAAVLANSLPSDYNNSIFVRYDTDRLDVMKVLIIGAGGTPYANGCFEFDVYFPPNYPNGPMLVNLETTGRHSVRFNPNLYNEGKVCLSVLNTWPGSPEEQWNPQGSSFFQVLLSIQALIMVEKPYFNEPGYERSKNTVAGENSSRCYNANIRQATVQWAMLDQLRNPSPCFATIIRNHFFLKKEEVKAQLDEWMMESGKKGSSTLRANIRALKEELEKLKPIINEGPSSV